jgi:hypothetical protein
MDLQNRTRKGIHEPILVEKKTQMKTTINRKDFLAVMGGTAAATLFGGNANAKTFEDNQPYSSDMNIQTFHPYFPSQDPQLVQEMVLVAHGQTEKVKELLAVHPELAKASWDWGYGDWETAIGAASHTGSKEIAELLMAHGARPDIFTFTMLGNLPAVKAMVDGNLGVQEIKGPHGITLLMHAKIRMMSKTINDADKQKGQAMIEYLTSLGNADNKDAYLDVMENDRKQFAGQFRFGEGPEDFFLVEFNEKGAMSIKKQGQKFERPLFRIDQTSFAPIGAPHVKVQFEIKDKVATSLTIQDPAPIARASRIL